MSGSPTGTTRPEPAPRDERRSAMHAASRPRMVAPGSRSRQRAGAGHYVLLAVATVLAVIFLFPFAWSMLGSFKPPGEMLREPLSVLPSRISFENYRSIASFGIGIWGYIGNTLFVTGLTIVGTVTLSTFAGYGFSRFEFRFKNVVFVVVLATLMIPFQGILVPLFLLLNRFGLTNSLIGLSLIYITFQLPFGIFMMRNSFDAVPREIEEAALVDGCGPVGALVRIMLPVALPGIATVVVFTFLASWNEFLAALVFLRESDKFTLPIMLNSVQAAQFGIIDWGALQAGVTITAVPAIVLFLALQRFYIRGLVQGAVKG